MSQKENMHINQNIQEQTKQRRMPGFWAVLVAVLCGQSVQASVVEFTGGPTTTSTNSEVYFSPVTGRVSTSYSDQAWFGVGNVSGDLAIAFNTTPDGTLVVAPNSLNPSLSTVARLSSGATIGPSSTLDNTEYTLAESDGLIGNWNQLGSGFFGFQFGTGTDVHYGWADITVLPDFNITLNSFAYETVAGEAITTPTAVPEPSSVLLIGFAGLGAALFGAYRRFGKTRATLAVLPFLLMGAISTMSGQTLPGQTDPVGGRLMQFRSDQLFNMSTDPATSSTNWSTFNTTVSNGPFALTTQDTSYSSTTAWYPTRQYHTASGRFLTPEHDNVVIVNGDGSNVDVQVVGYPQLSMQLPNLLPRYVQTLSDGSTHPSIDWISVAVGDLDHTVDSSSNYHDEVVIAYIMNDGTYQVVVLDFSNSVIDPTTNTLSVQLPKVISYAALNGVKYSSSIMAGPSLNKGVVPDDNLLSVAIGNFDGDGSNEIALGAVTDSSGENIQTIRYRGEISQIYGVSNQKIPAPTTIVVDGATFPATTVANVELTAGDYEGRGASDLAAGSLQLGGGRLPQFAVNILRSSLQPTSVQAQAYPGNPTRLWISDDPMFLGSIPKQITISGITGTWNRLNGTWPTTMQTFSQNGVTHMGIQIPVDTSDISADSSGSSSVPLTINLSTGIAQIPGAQPLLIPSSKEAIFIKNNDPDNFPRFRLLSGLFKYDPGNSFDFSRRQLAVVFNFRNAETSGSLGSFISSWYSVSADSQGIPQFTPGASNNILYPDNTLPQHTFEVTTGAFRGNTLALNPDKTAAGPATWPVILNAWYNNGQQVLYAIDAGASGEVITVQSSTTASYDPQQRFGLVNYDADGNSVYLGAPVRLSTTAFYTPTLILEEPPKHLAWFPDLRRCLSQPGLSGPGICNVNRNDGFNVQFQSQTGQQLSGSNQTQSSTTTTSLTTISAGASLNLEFPFGIGNKTSIQDTYKIGSDVENTSSYYNSSNTEISYTSTAETDHDDFVRGQTQNLNVWRYRVYGAQGSDPSGYLYYDLAYPTSPYDASTPGLGTDWYNPIHENGNLLSYPAQPGSGLPADVGPAYTVNNQVPGNLSNGIMYSGVGFCFGGTSGPQTISMAGVSSATDTVGWTKTNTTDNDLNVSDTLTLKAVELNASYDSDWGQKQSLSNTTSSNNTLSGSTSVTFNVDDGEDTQGYNIFPVLYNSTAGVLKFIHYVDIPTQASSGNCSAGGKFWTDNYGGAPDPALNLPFRFTFSGYNKSGDTTTWNLNTDLDRENLRGFFITSATANPIESTADNPVYDPVSINPVVGSMVRLAVRVYNYSVSQPTGNITVNFSAVPYDSKTDNELACGTPGSTETGRHCAPNVRTPLGSTPINSIPAWGGQNWALASYNWQIPSDFVTKLGTPEFRIYVTLAYEGSELHPPQQPCNNSPASNPQPCPLVMITDTTDPNYDPNAPGQNNEGFGLITIQAQSLQAIPPGGGTRYTGVHTVGDSLAAIGPDGRLKSGLVVAYLGRPLRLRVKAVAENADEPSQQKAFIYDGSRPHRTMIAGKILRGVATKGSNTWFNWAPGTLGLHQLTLQIPSSQNGTQSGNQTAKLSVVVVRLPGDVNGDGVVDAHDTTTILDQIGKGVSESTCGSACDLNGDGVIGRADLELAMAHCDHAYCAATPRSSVLKKAASLKPSEK